nr:transposase (putative), gypsy type [Tanacetum cinerariifolium]
MGACVRLLYHSSIKARILEAQRESSKDVNSQARMLKGLDKKIERKEEGGLYFAEQIWKATPIAMSWRHHDSSVVDSFPKPEEFNELEVERLREVVITLYKPGPSLLYVVGLSNVWKLQVAIGMLLPPGTARLTHTTLPTTRLEDILPKTGYLEVAEIPFRKLLAEKEKKRKKAEAKAATKEDALERATKAVDKKHT